MKLKTMCMYIYITVPQGENVPFVLKPSLKIQQSCQFSLYQAPKYNLTNDHNGLFQIILGTQLKAAAKLLPLKVTM